jgi:YidC/Oxa1 family membrane protein insertase
LAEIKNPNQSGGGGMDSRSLLIMSLVFLMVFLGLEFLKNQHKFGNAPEPVSNSAAQHAPAPTSQVTQPQPIPAAPAANSKSSANTPAPTIAADSEQTTTIENELYRITFDNRGAQVTQWIVKRYTDDQGKPLDLVNPVSSRFGYPMSLYVSDKNLRTQLAQALYVPSQSGTILAPGSISFDYESAGLSVHKTFAFDASYVLHATISVVDNGQQIPALLSWPAGLGDQNTPALYASGEVAYLHNGDTEHTAAKKVADNAQMTTPLGWAGVSDLYFAAMFLPDQPDTASLVTLNNEITIPRNFDEPNNGKTVNVDALGVALGSTTGPTELRLYVGPKALDVLKGIRATGTNGRQNGPSLESLVNFGFWNFMAKPLFLALHFTYDHVVRNWGWAIVVLTLVIMIILLPLRISGMRSQFKMARIQPQIAAIKAKYKAVKFGDPRQQQMQKEIMELQKSEGVNVLGGCLPTLIQLPLLFAFYEMLLKAIDLRHAHFLWLPDLSLPDPWHVMPIFVIISMFFMQFMTPMPGQDPMQRKIMAVTMPITMGWFMWNLSSGLSLYYALSNAISIGQQLIMNQTHLGREMRRMTQRRASRKTQGKPQLRR